MVDKPKQERKAAFPPVLLVPQLVFLPWVARLAPGWLKIVLWGLSGATFVVMLLLVLNQRKAKS